MKTFKTADNLATKPKQRVSKNGGEVQAKKRHRWNWSEQRVEVAGTQYENPVAVSTDVTPPPAPTDGSNCLRFEDFSSSNDTLKVGDLVITKGNEIALYGKLL